MASWKRRQVREEADRNNRAGGGYAGPDGSGQWVSVGELGWGEDLDAALGDVATGMDAQHTKMQAASESRE